MDFKTEGSGCVNKALRTVSDFVASLSTTSSPGNEETSGPVPAGSGPDFNTTSHSKVRDNAFLGEGSSDGEVSATDHSVMAMSYESISASPGCSVHQIESERDLEENGNTGDAVLPTCIFCEDLSSAREIDSVADPMPENGVCTHYCYDDDDSNPSLYTLSSADMAEFEDFSVPRTHRAQANPPIKRQTSLLSFMSKSSKSGPSTNSKQWSVAGISQVDGVIPTDSGKAANTAVVQSGSDVRASGGCEGNRTNGRIKRTCPFYKRIPGSMYNNGTMY